MNQQGTPPRIRVDASWQVLVGEKLSILVEASDADEDGLTFYIKGRPESAQFAALPDGQSALFTWTPEVTEADPGGTSYEVEFVVEDDTGAWDSQVVTIAVYPQWAPTFLNPPGYIIDLADESHIEFIVAVKDDAANRIEITMEEAPDGAYIEQSEKKEAYFFWRPEPEQIAQKRFWFVRFLARGYASSNTGDELLYELHHDIILVIINADFEGCSGHPPVIEHTIPGDFHPEEHPDAVNGYPINAFAQDLDSYVERMQLYWSASDSPQPGDFKPLPMPAIGEDSYRGTIPSIEAGSGRAIHYYLEAFDNDDYAGTSCDQSSRVPKDGFYSFMAYDAGFSDACADDPYEPNDQFGDSWFLDLGSHPGLRLCGALDDYLLFTLSDSQVAVTVQGLGNGEDLRVEALDGAGNPIGPVLQGDGSFSLNQGQLGGMVLVVHAWSYTGLPITYNLTVALQDSECVEDSLEGNDSPEKATGITAGEFPALSICVGDVDYFRIEADASTIIKATASFENSEGDLDVFLLDDDGETVLDAAETSSNSESVSYNVVQAGTYYIAIEGYLGATNSYNLTVEFGDMNLECVEDSFAPNQVESEAVITPPHTYDKLVACPNSDDWFELGLNGGEDLWIDIQDESHQLAVDVMGQSGFDPLCDEETSNQGILLYCHIDEAGDYAVRVANSTQTTVLYTLDLQVENPPGVCPIDRFEPNDAPGAAVEMPQDTLTWLTLCNSDEDWFLLQGFPGQVLFAGLVLPDGSQPIDVYLYADDESTLLGTSDSASGYPYVEATLSYSGLYFLMVKGANPTLNQPYSLLTWMQ